MAATPRVWAALLVLGAVPAVGRPPDPPAGAARAIEVQPGGGFGTISPDGKHLVATGGGEIRVYELPDGRETLRMQFPAKIHAQVAYAADRKHLVSASHVDRKLRHWSLANGKQVREFDFPRADTYEWIVGFSPDGRRLALKVKGGIILVDSETGREVLEIAGAGPGEGGFSQAGGVFTRDSKRFVAGAGKGRLGVWDAATGKQLVVTPGGGRDRSYSGEFCGLAISPDGKWVAASNGGIVGQPFQVWDLATCELLAEPAKAQSYSGSVAWTPDGSCLVRTDLDGVKAIDVATGKEVHRFEPPGGGGNLWGVMQGTTPDGAYLVFERSQFRQEVPGSVVLLPPPVRPRVAPKAELTAAELDEFWADLPSVNKIRAEQIRVAVEAAPGSWVPYVLRKVRPAGAGDTAKLRSLLADLDAESPDVRRAAQERLAPLAHRNESLLREALAAAPAGEVRNRLTFLLGEVKEKPMPHDLAAELRAVEVLARMPGPEARRALGVLADRAPESRVTEAARAVLGADWPPKR